MMFWNHGDLGVGGWVVMSVFMIAFWGLIIVFVVWLMRNAGSDRTTARDEGLASVSADELLAGRFARGEINEDEFTSRRALLHTTASSAHSAGGHES